MIKIISVISAIFLFLSRADAAPDPPLANARIALRFGIGKVLIVGGMVNSDGTIGATRLPELAGNPPFLPAHRIREVTPEFIGHLNPAPKPKTPWQIGASWQIYPGAGPAVTVVIEKLVFLEHPCFGGYDGAIGRIVSLNSVNQIAGMRASEYLAVPGAGLANVSEVPLFPIDFNEDVNQTLLRKAREIVRNENWRIEGSVGDQGKLQEMNRSVLASGVGVVIPSDVRIFQWPVPGRIPLFFVQALWRESPMEPLFAATAVLEKPGSWKILSFNATEAELMRIPEFRNHTWRIADMGGFLNAWKIGTRYFVLTNAMGYESFSVELNELDFKRGLIPIFGYAAGC